MRKVLAKTFRTQRVMERSSTSSFRIGSVELHFQEHLDDAIIFWLEKHLGAIDASWLPTAARFQITSDGNEVTLAKDSIVLLDAAPIPSLLPRLMWELNQLASARRDIALLHAAACVAGDTTLVIVGRPDAGKSTMVAALCAAGARYITDEIVGIDATGQISGYAKPIGLDAGSWSAVPQLELAMPNATSWPYFGQVNYWTPTAVAPRPTGPTLIILPEFGPDLRFATTSVEPARALLALVQQSFNVYDVAQEIGLSVIAGLVRKAPTHQAQYQSTAQILQCIDSLLGAP